MNDLIDDAWQMSATVALAPVQKLGDPELLRVAAAFVPYLSTPLGSQLAEAAHQAGIRPAIVTELGRARGDEGALAMIEGQAFAFGRLSFLREVGVAPHQAEVIAGERLERAGYAAYYVISLTRFHCLGIVGIRPLPDTSS
ncbi:MAG TPA: hypothetical protein VMV29_06770 [Ktedonobacterales bacterium]|nr:hypothetical protein [Ktedonobacterales bacterium]